MTKDHINELISGGSLPEPLSEPELLETHISWVLVCGRFTYKIKKPLKYSFLDFSSLEKRKYFCAREVELNSRLTDGIYLDVLPVRSFSGRLIVDENKQPGTIIDYAVRMNTIDRSRQMNHLLLNNRVTAEDMRKLADKMAAFHAKT